MQFVHYKIMTSNDEVADLITSLSFSSLLNTGKSLKNL